MNTHLIWYRSDLRVHDHPALKTAMHEDARVIAVYCLTPQQWQRHCWSKARLSLALRQVQQLNEALAALNVPLIVVNTDSLSGIPDALSELAQRFEASKVFTHVEYEWNEAHCAQQVEKKLAQKDISLHSLHDQCAIAPGKVRTQQGDMYKVFSAFKREYVKCFRGHSRDLGATPEPQSSIEVTSDLDAVQPLLDDLPEFDDWPAGEEVAHARLNDFIDERITRYKDERDFPDRDATSQLSPYLAAGILTTRQCLHAAMNVNEGELESGRKGVDTWVSELIWRDFYRHLLSAYPDVSRHRAFKPETDRLPWKHDEALFAAWCEGRTGYPIVDAAMRQLCETSWMHNRLRMVTAMFLTKHLFIDWRWGEQFFMQHLVDGDLASNNGGWQWSASTGVDAVPYFRIFNPVRQSERFDPDGAFIRKFVPELSELKPKAIHWPSEEERQRCGYPAPIVDHKQAVAQTKQWFKELNDERATQDERETA